MWTAGGIRGIRDYWDRFYECLISECLISVGCKTHRLPDRWSVLWFKQRGRPWDNPLRRPSHADKRRSIAKQMLRKKFLTCLPKGPEFERIRHAIDHLISLRA